MTATSTSTSRRRPARRRLAPWAAAALTIAHPLGATFMAWKALCVLTNSSSPVVCVVSESMAPAFHRGDVLLMSNWPPSVEAGDIPVVWFEGHPLPMVHRVVQVHSDEHGQTFVTKGDNNNVDDVGLYPGDRTSVSREEVVGFVRGYVPFLGWLVIGFQDFYWAKWVMAVFVSILFLVGL